MSASRKPPRPRAFAPDPAAPGQPCEVPGCTAMGEYRAPKNRTHVREYNAGWDYYKGLSPDQIEHLTREDSSWQRPTWPLGRLGQSRMDEAVEAELHAFAFGSRAHTPPAPSTPPDLREALTVLGLAWPVTFAAVKTKYKELAKRHHPDANNGDKQSEERLKTINLAYATLRGKLGSAAPQAAGS
jgi:hypothetical protein